MIGFIALSVAVGAVIYHNVERVTKGQGRYSMKKPKAVKPKPKELPPPKIEKEDAPDIRKMQMEWEKTQREDSEAEIIEFPRLDKKVEKKKSKKKSANRSKQKKNKKANSEMTTEDSVSVEPTAEAMPSPGTNADPSTSPPATDEK
ncbi:hypothetical protein QR680_006468 [Steinernema hermaphroditum]|uniref:Uncharacterized protein n=1 Tax=Steinernema hermaphroditum TaxID=289476 RepID=A0AA39HVJ6_9BILA|nr:hypothetical protein QR680_006468 [Steinernema hermaphroditum]